MSFGEFMGDTPTRDLHALPTAPKERGPDDDGSFRRRSRRDDNQDYEPSRSEADTSWSSRPARIAHSSKRERVNMIYNVVYKVLTAIYSAHFLFLLDNSPDDDGSFRRRSRRDDNQDYEPSRSEADTSWRRGGGGPPRGGGGFDDRRGGGGFDDRRGGGGFEDRR
eukprot:CAMPEP_0194158912 /NCGR_PEP_ID=MMETSP0152-20130528/77541_1 /TAXON_ID=1049557 /ORGANISM="Thalassiothrix antarctica, Strain L6-D1" /LENGTH=164 /DNA_ID=CAMNT_0038868427 /DNA_START=213 /DNA_END=705 /DNA_ORIENTATION=+